MWILTLDKFNFTNFILNIVSVQYNLIFYKYNILLLLFIFKMLHKLYIDVETILFIICILHFYF